MTGPPRPPRLQHKHRPNSHRDAANAYKLWHQAITMGQQPAALQTHQRHKLHSQWCTANAARPGRHTNEDHQWQCICKGQARVNAQSRHSRHCCMRTSWRAQVNGIQTKHLLTRPQACPLTGAESLCALLWLARGFVTVCAGGVTGAARRERRIGEPAQQAAWSARKSAILTTVESRHETQTK